MGGIICFLWFFFFISSFFIRLGVPVLCQQSSLLNTHSHVVASTSNASASLIFFRSPHQIFGSRRHSWQGHMSRIIWLKCVELPPLFEVKRSKFAPSRIPPRFEGIYYNKHLQTVSQILAP